MRLLLGLEEAFGICLTSWIFDNQKGKYAQGLSRFHGQNHFLRSLFDRNRYLMLDLIVLEC